jgi:hypothetical protein
MAIASPAFTPRRAGWPALDSSTARISAGDPAVAPAVSRALTAKPSIAELSKPGTASALVTSAARTRPSASRSATSSGPRAVACSSTSLRAGSTSISSRGIDSPGAIVDDAGVSGTRDRSRPPIGVVLAGGQALRLGGAKATAQLGGRSLAGSHAETHS